MLELFFEFAGLSVGAILEIIVKNIFWFFAFTLFFYYRFGNRKILEFVYSWALVLGMFFMFNLLGVKFIGRSFTFETIGIIGIMLPIMLTRTKFEKNSGKIAMTTSILLSFFFSWF
ncbi:MAG: hypothetical protein Q7K42_03005 [Candidatus Diapherotrites archaeon]|nr:hypothetical protein [Candidatus Diapherotrites archaeon]